MVGGENRCKNYTVEFLLHGKWNIVSLPEKNQHDINEIAVIIHNWSLYVSYWHLYGGTVGNIILL